MRVSSGAIKGARLRSPRGLMMRPTASKVKQAIFDIMGSRLLGAWVADLFAGAGTVGIEALSRGASHVVFVEHHARTVRLLKENLKSCGLDLQATVCAMDAISFIHTAQEKQIRGALPKFDILFADPPYHGPLAGRLLRQLGRSDLMNSGGTVIMEHFHKNPLPPQSDHLTLAKRYRYGDTFLSLYQPSREREELREE